METARSGAGSFAQTEINWDKIDKTKFYVVGAGIFNALTVGLYPISVVKTRMQVATKDSVEKNAYAVIRGLLKTEGVRGLYRGFGPVITGAIPSRIVLITALETTKVSAFKMIKRFELSEPLEAAIANGIAGMTAALFGQFVFVPIDVVSFLMSTFVCRCVLNVESQQVSQRLMVQGYSGHESYNGGLDVARKVLKQDGIRGLYRGFGLSVMTYSPSSAIWWASYGSSQRVIWRLLGHGTEIRGPVPSQGTIVLVQGTGGICAAAAASLTTTPLDTVKTRLQKMAGKVSVEVLVQDSLAHQHGEHP
ncbi:hypothetical protein L1987_52436 [Smallanthus sonchifolius]|uniref:Uncharacterized protein n=1 Tax=Smallanthus sonchifolius TaxID=185202 RepID=A0ACB9ETQ9_9ASTR|nr:hypothetical protein L1987_52436 [Smallanthus sonchifolius]